MITIRPVRWPDDGAAICAIDPSFATDRIYRLYRQDLAFTLVEVPGWRRRPSAPGTAGWCCGTSM